MQEEERENECNASQPKPYLLCSSTTTCGFCTVTRSFMCCLYFLCVVCADIVVT